MYGRSVVREALKHPRRVEKIWCVQGESSGSIFDILETARVHGLPVERVPRVRIDALCAPYGADGHKVNHQGVACLVSAQDYWAIEDLIAQAKDQNTLILVLTGLSDPHNLGAVLRSAACFDVCGVVLPKHRSVGMTSAVVRSSAGAAQHVRVCRVTNIAQCLRTLKEQGFFVWGADLCGTAVQKVDLRGRIALVLGGEHAGIPPLVRKLCDGMLNIPMPGEMESLNASVAAGVLLYEWRRQADGV